MDLSRLRPLPVIAGLLALAALDAHAQQPKRLFGEGDVTARNLMSDCATVWTVKDRQTLMDADKDIADSTQSTLAFYVQARQQALQLVVKAERELDRLNDTLAVASFAEATAMERAQNKGLISKEQAMAVAANVAQNTARAAREAAEAELTTARSLLNGVNRRMVG